MKEHQVRTGKNAEARYRCVYTQKPIHTETSTRKSVCKQHAFTQKSVYTEKLRHTETYKNKLLHTANSYTQERFTQRAFAHGKLLPTVVYSEKLFTQQAFTQRNFYTHTHTHTQHTFIQKRICIQICFTQKL